MKPIGYIERHPISSRALAGNLLGDPTERLITLYIPPGYHENPRQSYPTVFLLAAHSKTGESFQNWSPWAETMEQRLDRLMSRGMPPAIVVMPDAFTRLGGSQYLNSAIGQYEDYLLREVLPFVDEHYRSNGRRGLVGHSSGGYGALVQAMRHPELFMAAGALAADMYWEYNCLPLVAGLHQGLMKYGGLESFVEKIESLQPKNTPFWNILMGLTCALVYGSNPKSPQGFDLPIDMETGALDQAVWERWLAYDPLRMIEDRNQQGALRQLKALYISAGTFDEYQSQVGARLFSRKLQAYHIPHVFEELPITHSGSEAPWDTALKTVIEALA
jgi:enterochelin esterase family protein